MCIEACPTSAAGRCGVLPRTAGTCLLPAAAAESNACRRTWHWPTTLHRAGPRWRNDGTMAKAARGVNVCIWCRQDAVVSR